MRMKANDLAALENLELRLQTMLPEDYQDRYEEMEPVPMRSAGLKYGADGRVAWNEIWGSFCDLALAGGPPHKGMLLGPGTRAEVEAEPDRYAGVTDELCRGIMMVTDLAAEPSPDPGWVRVECLTRAMAGWLLRAIVVENVAARCQGNMLDLPAAPHFRIDKEIKNVVTVIAKTCHYWLGHMSRGQHHAITDLLGVLEQETPLVAPAWSGAGVNDGESAVRSRVSDVIERETTLRPSNQRYGGWLGVECPSVRTAIWMMRALVVSNVLARREGTVLFVPVDSVSDPDGGRVVSALARIRGLAVARGIL
jgi:hypothetical protein